MRRFAALAAALLVLATPACALIPASTPEPQAPSVSVPQPEPEPTEPDAPPAQLVVGDCTGALQPGSSRQPAALDCTTSHAWEVFAVVPVTAATLPAEDDLADLASQECLPAFRSYIGVAPAYSRYDAVYLSPDASTWDDPAARVLTCLAGQASGGLTGSAKGDSTLFPEPGECTGPQDVGVLEVEVLDCEDEHYWEAYAQKSLDSAPTDTELASLLKDVCEARFEKFIGLSVAKSDYEYAYFVPPAADWKKLRDHRIVCSAGSPKGGVSGSLKGIKH